MLIQWCLKGIPFDATAFDDDAAYDALTRSGLRSQWARAHAGTALDTAWPDAHAALSQAALVAHVNAYATVRATTPYISLTAGVIERDPGTRTARRHGAWRTAVEFATRAGRHDGYVFECWVPLPGNPGPELPGFGEEVRNLTLHRRLALWTHQGEIAAKLIVAPRQIRRVIKFGSNLKRLPLVVNGAAVNGANPDFVPPERVSNIRPLV